MKSAVGKNSMDKFALLAGTSFNFFYKANIPTTPSDLVIASGVDIAIFGELTVRYSQRFALTVRFTSPARLTTCWTIGEVDMH